MSRDYLRTASKVQSPKSPVEGDRVGKRLIFPIHGLLYIYVYSRKNWNEIV